MRKTKVAAALAAVSILLCACGKKDDTDAKTKLSKKSQEVTSEAKEKTDDTADTETTDAAYKPAFDLDKDLFSFYADDSHKLMSNMTCIMSAQTSWSTIIDLDLDAKTFQGEYQSATGNIDGDGYDVLECDFNGTFDGFTRVNEYSYSTHVLTNEFKEFDPRDEKYMDMPAHVTFSEPYGFVKPDELILFLPNTPVSQMPKEALEWLEGEVAYTDTLNAYAIYNVSEKAAFYVSKEYIPETRDLNSSDLKDINEQYLDKQAGVILTVDKSSQTATLTRGDTEYKDLHMRVDTHADNHLILYGTNSKGKTVILSLDCGPRILIEVLESNDPMMPTEDRYLVE
jgi:hypothetical protein